MKTDRENLIINRQLNDQLEFNGAPNCYSYFENKIDTKITYNLTEKSRLTKRLSKFTILKKLIRKSYVA